MRSALADTLGELAETAISLLKSTDNSMRNATKVADSAVRLEAVAAALKIEAERMLYESAASAILTTDGEQPGGDRTHGSDDDHGDSWVTRLQVASAEYAPIAGCSTGSAQYKISASVAASRHYRPLLAALARAEVTPTHLAKFKLLVDDAALSDEQKEEVCTRVMEHCTWSLAKFNRHVRAAIRLILARDGVIGPSTKSWDNRYIRITLDHSGVGYLEGMLGQPECLAVRTAIQDAARTADSDDPRSQTQLEADAFVTLILGPARLRRSPDLPPAEDLALFDEVGRPIVEHDEQRAVDQIVAQLHDLADSIDLTVPRTPRVTINLTIPIGMVSAGCPEGGDERPVARAALLDSEYPIDPEITALLLRDARWRRIVTDPVSGQILDFGSRLYRPPQLMRNRIISRDKYCRFPNCSKRAEQCDIDHVEPFGLGGATADENLICLCRAHHRIKHQTTWRLRMLGTGQAEWTTPTGRIYLT